MAILKWSHSKRLDLIEWFRTFLTFYALIHNLIKVSPCIFTSLRLKQDQQYHTWDTKLFHQLLIPITYQTKWLDILSIISSISYFKLELKEYSVTTTLVSKSKAQNRKSKA